MRIIIHAFSNLSHVALIHFRIILKSRTLSAKYSDVFGIFDAIIGPVSSSSPVLFYCRKACIQYYGYSVYINFTFKFGPYLRLVL